ncbi:MAG: ATP-binding cassette domain-containing protein [Nitrospira sp.]|nr:ATP-binding cassette domain-containing protein [Nitrospira sp.]HNP29848.1 ATP-binding cassette domain-containing protein [Nitrospirales bacterium]
MASLPSRTLLSWLWGVPQQVHQDDDASSSPQRFSVTPRIKELVHMKPWAIETQHVSKQFPNGAYALRDIEWGVQEGETMALIGESGSGKTTLLRLLNRLAEPTDGIVFIQGKPACSQDPIQLRRRLGYVPQDGGLFPHWTINQNVCLVPQLLGWTPIRQLEQVTKLLPLLNLDPAQIAERYPTELSGGQRQRVAVARALAADPPIVLLDEPFGALDPLTRHDLQDQFLSLKTRLQKTMVLITHDMSEAFRLGDRITILKEGHIHQIGTPQELLHSPATPYVDSLIQHYHAHPG